MTESKRRALLIGLCWYLRRVSRPDYRYQVYADCGCDVCATVRSVLGAGMR